MPAYGLLPSRRLRQTKNGTDLSGLRSEPDIHFSEVLLAGRKHMSRPGETGHRHDPDMAEAVMPNPRWAGSATESCLLGYRARRHPATRKPSPGKGTALAVAAELATRHGELRRASVGGVSRRTGASWERISASGADRSHPAGDRPRVPQLRRCDPGPTRSEARPARCGGARTTSPGRPTTHRGDLG